MPERQTFRRFPSDEVQGEGSWVELKYMTWGNATRAFKGEYDATPMIKEHLVDWNWVDEDGKKLEMSADVLFEHEKDFIINLLFSPRRADSKN